MAPVVVSCEIMHDEAAFPGKIGFQLSSFIAARAPLEDNDAGWHQFKS